MTLGVDYLDRAHGNSLSKIKSYFGDWRTKKDDVLAFIESYGQVGPKCRAALPNYATTFQKASNIFQFAPYFVIVPLTPGQSPREAFWNDNYGIIRADIRALESSSPEVTLFAFDPDDHLPSGFQLKEFFTMAIWIRTSCNIQQFAIPIPRN